MQNPRPSPPYPVEAFHAIIKDAVWESSSNIQASDALICMSMLATMAAACQGLVDVELPTGQTGPVSLFLLLIANSGDRKTSVDNIATAPLYALDELWSSIYDQSMASYKTQHAAWTAIAGGLRRKLIKAAQHGSPLGALKVEHANHLAAEPIKPRRRRVIRHGMTERALMEAMWGNGESIAFHSDEGDILLKGGMNRQLGLLNSAWSGAREITHDWGHGESLVCRNPRAVINLMLQEQVLREHMDRHGDRWRGSGHLARYLVAAPQSLQGRRYAHKLDQDWRAVPVFHKRISALLEEYRIGIDAGPITRQVLQFSEDAKRLWAEQINRLERDLGPWGYYRDVSDAASKAMEMAGRIAAVLHTVSSQEGLISVDTVERAMRIVDWHLLEFRRVFARPPEPQEFADARVLEQYLDDRFFSRGQYSASKNMVLRSGPIRPAHRMRAALEVLISERVVHTWQDRSRRYWIERGPDPRD